MLTIWFHSLVFGIAAINEIGVLDAVAINHREAVDISLFGDGARLIRADTRLSVGFCEGKRRKQGNPVAKTSSRNGSHERVSSVPRNSASPRGRYGKWATFFTARHSDTDPERQYDIRSEKWNPLGGVLRCRWRVRRRQRRQRPASV